jgi:hypothetical protein
LGSTGTHPWKEYAERTVNYVFSYAGDKSLKERNQYINNWKKLEDKHLTRAKTTDQTKETARTTLLDAGHSI